MSKILPLPPDFDFNQPDILKKALQANIALAELNGLIYSLPSYELLLQPLTAREAVASSEIENIRTTTLDILQAEIDEAKVLPKAQKETLRYKNALQAGYELTKKYGFIATNQIVGIQEVLEPDKSGIRTTMGTVIADGDGNIVHTPPQHEQEIRVLLKNLDDFTNNFSNHGDLDPLIKMAILHFQFESIHPFYDGNGRTGRILMVLYLYLVNRLRFPVLFISGYILKHKDQYYQYLNDLQNGGDWKQWILYILDAVEIQARETAGRITGIKHLQEEWKQMLKIQYPKIYSVDFLDYIFSKAFYTQTQLAKATGITRPTAIKYLEILLLDGKLKEQKLGKERLFYIPDFITLLS